MVYRRKGRPGFSFQARTQTGWEQIGVGDTGKPLAQRIEQMWETLASEHRAWDILNPIIESGRLRPNKIKALYDLWISTKHDVGEIRHRLADTDVEPLVAEYMAVYRKRGFREATAKYTESHIRYLLPKDVPRLASSLTEDALTTKLYEYQDKHGAGVSPDMLRKVHSSWSGFFAYLVRPKRLYATSPMTHVIRPEATKPTPRFYELDSVIRIVEGQPTVKRKALMALMYGSGIETAVVVGIDDARKPLPGLTRADFDPDSHEARAAGAKTHTRDRVALIAEWAWPHVWAYIRELTPHAPIAPHDRSTLGDWHREVVRALKLKPEYPLHGARHHWAVRMLRSGTPVAVVQSQLGHATAKETLDLYGPFIPSGEDRKKWERRVTAEEKKLAKKAEKRA